MLSDISINLFQVYFGIVNQANPALYTQIAPQRAAHRSDARRALKAMVVPLQESATQQMADWRLARRESFQTGHTGVAALANGITIALRTAPWPDPSGKILKRDLCVKGRANPIVFHGFVSC